MIWIIRSSFPALRKIVPDNIAAFIEAGLAASCERLKIQRLLAPPEYPQRNGRVERANRQLKQHLYPLMTTHPEQNFPLLLDQATNIYNNSPQLHGYSPSFLAFGCEQWYPGSEGILKAREKLLDRTCESEGQTQIDDAEERAAVVIASDLPTKRSLASTKKHLRDAIRAVRLEESAVIQHYSPGDFVLRVRVRQHKHEPYYDGPWRVLTVDN